MTAWAAGGLDAERAEREQIGAEKEEDRERGMEAWKMMQEVRTGTGFPSLGGTEIEQC